MTPRRMPRCIAWLVKSFSADRATSRVNAVQGAPSLIPVFRCPPRGRSHRGRHSPPRGDCFVYGRRSNSGSPCEPSVRRPVALEKQLHRLDDDRERGPRGATMSLPSHGARFEVGELQRLAPLDTPIAVRRRLARRLRGRRSRGRWKMRWSIAESLVRSPYWPWSSRALRPAELRHRSKRRSSVDSRHPLGRRRSGMSPRRAAGSSASGAPAIPGFSARAISPRFSVR